MQIVLSSLRRVERARTIGAVSVILLALIPFASSCSATPSLSTISAAEAIGTWKSSTAGKIVLSSENRFTATGLRFESSFLKDCEASTISGQWEFFSNGDHGASDPDVTKGKLIAIMAEGSDNKCSFDLQVHQEKESFALCVDIDPDKSCDEGVAFYKK